MNKIRCLCSNLNKLIIRDVNIIQYMKGQE